MPCHSPRQRSKIYSPVTADDVTLSEGHAGTIGCGGEGESVRKGGGGFRDYSPPGAENQSRRGVVNERAGGRHSLALFQFQSMSRDMGCHPCHPPLPARRSACVGVWTRRGDTCSQVDRDVTVPAALASLSSCALTCL